MTSSSSRDHRMERPLKSKLFSKNFILLWLGQTVSQLGAGVGYIATLWWVQTTTGSALALGTLATVTGIVAVVMSPIAGVFVDRWNKKYLIVGTDLIRGSINCLLAWLVYTNTLTLPILFLCAGIKAACAQFFIPSISTAIPQIVPDEHLEKANSLREISLNISNMIGYALGGLLVAVAGIPALLLINGIAFLLSAFSETFIVLAKAREQGKLTVKAFSADLASGLSYVRRDKVLSGILQVILVINFALVPFFVLMPKFVAEHLRAGSEVLGLISSAQMAGMILGALIISLTPLVKKHHWIIRWGMSISAGALMISPWLPGDYWQLQLLVFGVSGAVNSIVNLFFFTSLQRKVDPAYMGKVFSLINAMGLGLQPAASALSGILAERIPLVYIYTAFGALAMLANVRLVAIPGLNAYFGFLSSKEMQEETDSTTSS